LPLEAEELVDQLHPARGHLLLGYVQTGVGGVLLVHPAQHGKVFEAGSGLAEPRERVGVTLLGELTDLLRLRRLLLSLGRRATAGMDTTAMATAIAAAAANRRTPSSSGREQGSTLVRSLA
jgi:hypothetical protein